MSSLIRRNSGVSSPSQADTADKSDVMSYEDTDKSHVMSYEDTEGLLTTVGIVATLTLSFVIALQFSLDKDLQTDYTFKAACFLDKEFCEYAVRVVEKQDGYNATVFIDYRDGQEEYFNVSANLCASFMPDGNGGFKREGWTIMPCSSGGMWNVAWSANYSAAIPFVSAAFPMEYLAGYMVYHDKALLEKLGLYAVKNFFRRCSKAAGLLIYAFIISVVLYVSLAFGQARERLTAGDDGVLRKFHHYLAPIISTCYVAVLGGCVQFYLAMESAMSIITPSFTKCALSYENTNSATIMGYIFAPTAVYIVYGLVKISASSRAAIHPDESREPAREEAHASSNGSDSLAEESTGVACLRVLRRHNARVGWVAAALLVIAVYIGGDVKPIDPDDQEIDETLQLIALIVLFIVNVDYFVRTRAKNGVPIATIVSAIVFGVFCSV